MSPTQATKWLRERGFVVATRTVQLWCLHGQLHALRTLGGQYRIPLATLRALLESNDLDAAV